MTIDATFWVMISFFVFVGLLIYFKLPQKIKATLDNSTVLFEQDNLFKVVRNGQRYSNKKEGL